LVVSDFDEGTLVTFMASLDIAREFITSSMPNDRCSTDDSDVLPFQAIVVVTPDEVTAARYGVLADVLAIVCPPPPQTSLSLRQGMVCWGSIRRVASCTR
jgi:hypothetical protein